MISFEPQIHTMEDNMLNLIESFPNQMRDAVKLGKAVNLNKLQKPNNVVISGLGGSGIGGKVVSQLVRQTADCPIETNNSYSLPGYVNENTLVIICSYSGNTEETISALEEAQLKKAQILCITSGGKVKEVAEENQYPLMLIPGGQPPRSQFGYSSIQLLFVMNALGFLGDGFTKEIQAAIDLIEHDIDLIKKLASRIARKISRRVPVIYAESNYEGVAIRWKQQFNENAKMLCWHNVIPEMNHNELVGWAGGDERFAAIILRNQDDFIKNKIRTDISQEIISRKSDMVMEVASKGDSAIEHVFYLVHLGDWMSYFLAKEREVDPVVIEEIDHLKSELSKY
jgi:glucose/mannose-6-phosphate isomerase